MPSIIVHNAQEWDNLINSLGGPAYIATKPESYPCIAKIAKTNIAKGQETVEVFVIMLFYKFEARALLGIERADIKEYKYAEAI